MAVAARPSVASLMKTIDRLASSARMKVKFRRNQVEQTLVGYVKNKDVEPYNELVEFLQGGPLTDENYQILFEDCLSSVILLDRDLTRFVGVVCDVEWVGRSEELVDMYSEFVLSLVTAHIYHCPRVLSSLVKLFKGKVNDENWSENPSEETLSKWSSIHRIIAQLVAIIPLSIDILMQTLIRQFPYYKAGCYANRAYVHNLIWISKYLASLQEQIMTAIVNRLVTMDVNVDRSKATPRTERTLEKTRLVCRESKSGGGEDVACTLDYCMLEVLRWLAGGRGPLLDAMWRVFLRVVLPTHGVRHVPFLLVHTMAISEDCGERVLAELWLVASGQHRLGPGALPERSAAARHLAGLLTRCAPLPPTSVTLYLKKMVDWCHEYIAETRETVANDNTIVHRSFDAVCHAVFYLIAFKSRYLFSSEENVNFVESLNLVTLVRCGLNPLRTCPRRVRRAFSAAARSHQLICCRAIIERNARYERATGRVHFDNWFPYDPYFLPVSGTLIRRHCVLSRGERAADRRLLTSQRQPCGIIH